jgi:hypothetical protein
MSASSPTQTTMDCPVGLSKITTWAGVLLVGALRWVIRSNCSPIPPHPLGLLPSIRSWKKRTEVRSPVDVTNLLTRVGDFARAGTPSLSVIDEHCCWIDAQF